MSSLRFKMRRRVAEMQNLIEKAITDLGVLNQAHLVGDIFEIYFNEHVVKMQSTVSDLAEIENDFLFKITELVNQYAVEERAIAILERVVQKCVSGAFTQHNQKLCLMLGERFLNQKFFSKAYNFFLRGGDIDKAIVALKQVMKSGYYGEQDLFVIRLCLEVLVRNYKNKQFAIVGA